MQSGMTNKILQRTKSIANTKQPIAVIGEYGSGKSWLARKIHESSNRENRPFIPLDCYTLETGEAQKKIYGYVQLTDQTAKVKKGLFEQCDGGTLFLERFDAFSERLQKQIFQSVEKATMQHIGGSEEFPINVRLILTIDVDSYHNAQRRSHLFLSTLGLEPYVINYPPLRQRREEIGRMVKSFLKDLPARHDLKATRISPRTLYQCIRYDWPGNVQQLKNAIEHAAIVSGDEKIQPEHLPKTVKQGQPDQQKLEYLEHTYTYRAAEKQILDNVLKNCKSPDEPVNMLDLSKDDLKKKVKYYELEPKLI